MIIKFNEYNRFDRSLLSSNPLISDFHKEKIARIAETNTYDISIQTHWMDVTPRHTHRKPVVLHVSFSRPTDISLRVPSALPIVSARRYAEQLYNIYTGMNIQLFADRNDSYVVTNYKGEPPIVYTLHYYNTVVNVHTGMFDGLTLAKINPNDKDVQRRIKNRLYIPPGKDSTNPTEVIRRW